MKFILDIETLGLEAQFDRILSIGVMNAETEEVKVFIDVEESVMLTQFWQYVIDATDFITFNGDSFDIPFLIKRSLINKVRITNLPSNHTDLRKLVNGFWVSYDKFGKGTLRDWAPILGVPVVTQSGTEMPYLFVKGDFDAITKHNTEDLVLTHKLYKLTEYCNLVRNK
jgi:uncharacterized protein YprB with RNaseH-like and TPR domain